jgi:DNA uptake protein ComE-like DNA-binding protein
MAMAMIRSDSTGPHSNKSKVAINFASEDELVKVPGVSKTFAAILLSIRAVISR